jgi:hypothetical protein
VVAVEMGEEDNVDRAWVDAELVQVGKQGSAAIEQNVPVDDDPGVVPLQGEGRPGTQEGDLQAIVTPVFR